MLRKAVVALSMSVFTGVDVLLSYTLVDLIGIMKDAAEVSEEWRQANNSV